MKQTYIMYKYKYKQKLFQFCMYFDFMAEINSHLNPAILQINKYYKFENTEMNIQFELFSCVLEYSQKN